MLEGIYRWSEVYVQQEIRTKNKEQRTTRFKHNSIIQPRLCTALSRICVSYNGWLVLIMRMWRETRTGMHLVSNPQLCTAPVGRHTAAARDTTRVSHRTNYFSISYCKGERHLGRTCHIRGLRRRYAWG